MSVWQGIGLSGVLLLALYGAACGMTRLVWRWVRPPRPSARIVLPLGRLGEDAEWQLRFAAEVSKQGRIPLWIVEDGAGTEWDRMAKQLCPMSQTVSFEEAEKMWASSCTAKENCV